MKRSNVKRAPTDEEREGWSAAQDARIAAPPKPQSIEAVRKILRHRNPIRWRQVQSDYKWVQKEMKRLGLNPEDARYIL